MLIAMYDPPVTPSLSLFQVVLLYIQNPFTQNISQSETQTANTFDQEVTAWTPYENNTYFISFDFPAGWHAQDYSSFYNTGGSLVAFSPGELPCGTCSYLNNGYFSLRVYNAQTDPNFYTLYLNKTKKVEEDRNYKKVSIDSKVGILFGNTVSIENEGWVFDLTLDKNNGNDAIENSPVMKHVISSFKFTKLFTK